jgi:hypothetical protein
MHVLRCTAEMADGESLFSDDVIRLSLSLFPAKEKRLLIPPFGTFTSSLPALRSSPPHSQKTDRSRSLGPACLYTKIQITLLSANIPKKENWRLFFFLLSSAGSE